MPQRCWRHMAKAPSIGLRDIAKRRLGKLRTPSTEEWERMVAEAKARNCELLLVDGVLVEIQMFGDEGEQR